MQHTLKRSFARYDAELIVNDAQLRNMDLTLTLRLGMKQINPKKGADTGRYGDYGKKGWFATKRDIVAWKSDPWISWKKKFESEVEAFWSGGFTLENSTQSFMICVGGQVYAPHVNCKLNLMISDGNLSTNHHNIEVVRLAETEDFFGSHSKLYDSKDTEAVTKAYDSNNKPITQKAHVHEVGHLLGLDHVNVGTKHCPASKDTNAIDCYGVTDMEKNSVMGSGMKIRASDAKPWQDAMVYFSTAVTHQKLSQANRDPSKVYPVAIIGGWKPLFASMLPKKVGV